MAPVGRHGAKRGPVATSAAPRLAQDAARRQADAIAGFPGAGNRPDRSPDRRSLEGVQFYFEI